MRTFMITFSINHPGLQSVEIMAGKAGLERGLGLAKGTKLI